LQSQPDSSAGNAQVDSLESCVFGLFNEIIGTMNRDISEVLRPKTTQVAAIVKGYSAAVSTKTSEIGKLFSTSKERNKQLHF
jgi:hypothetical protein